MDDNQTSFLRTVQACGTSLVETVNHVLDFTKLSGNTKGGGIENVILPSKFVDLRFVRFCIGQDLSTFYSRVDLSQVVEEAVEGCWIGSRARLSLSQSEIGSVYAPPPQVTTLAFVGIPVETVIDIQYRTGVSLYSVFFVVC